MSPLAWSGEVVSQSFTSMWYAFVSFVPTLIIAILIVLLAWIIGSALSKVIQKAFEAIKLDSALRTAGLNRLLDRMSVRLDSGKFIGTIVKWFVIIVGVIASLELIGLSDVNLVLKATVLGYLPQVIKAIFILFAAVLLGEFMKNVVSSGARAARVSSANFLGAVAKWTIWIFGVMAAIYQLNIAAAFVQTLFTGVVVALALAFGLAFGLGGRDAAAQYLEKVKKEISNRNHE